MLRCASRCRDGSQPPPGSKIPDGEAAMLIVDAQVHVWSSGKPSGQHRQVSSFSAEDCLAEMDAAGVDAALLHPPGWDVYGVAVAEAAARKYPNRFAIL